MPRAASALAWSDPVERVKGIGPAAGEKLRERGIGTVADLVWTLPVAWEDARSPLSVSDAVERARAGPTGARVCVRGVVKSATLVPMRGRRSVRVTLVDDGGRKSSIALWWFFAAHGVLALAQPGAALLVSGDVRVEAGKPPRMAHPDARRDEPAARVVRPRYPRLGVPEAVLRKAIALVLEELGEPPELVPPAIAHRERFSSARAFLARLHGHGEAAQVGPSAADRGAGIEHLAWAEAFTRAWQRVVADGSGVAKATPMPPVPSVIARLRAELGFAFTAEQDLAVAAIARDLARDVPMRRLLFGDVGTGKTAVALAAAAQCVSAGAQVAILAPTSVLAEQYMEAVGPLARATGASVALLAAGVPAAQRQLRAKGLAEGTLAVAVGTHALLREEIQFKNLGLVLVDEQHRLGVAQRLTLAHKRGQGTARPHLLTLSATPIPRTLALALRGELETSELGARPKGRPPVTTELTPQSRFAAVVDALRAACARGEQAFVVASRIDDAEEGDTWEGVIELAGALTSSLAPHAVGLVHGGLSADDRRRAMTRFRAGKTRVLVGTTVLEVGIDVPGATVMVVCGAERFGLAQLHQLRGRVGRGDKPGRCVLVHADDLDALARSRLDALVRLERGVDVAKADLELRGAGDLGGTRQSGAAGELFYLDPASPPAWLARIDDDARAFFASDPALASHPALRLAVDRFSVAIAAREEAG